jgi:uncharacterized RDD family membrane protein YckC
VIVWDNIYCMPTENSKRKEILKFCNGMHLNTVGTLNKIYERYFALYAYRYNVTNVRARQARTWGMRFFIIYFVRFFIHV